MRRRSIGAAMSMRGTGYILCMGAILLLLAFLLIRVVIGGATKKRD